MNFILIVITLIFVFAWIAVYKDDKKNKEKNKKTAFRKQDSGNPDDYAYDDRLSPVFRLSDYLGASVVIF